MTLKELKKMIAEEYAAYKRSKKRKLSEQPIPMPPGPGGPMDLPDAPGIAVSGDDVDATGGGGDAEATLNKIQDMINAYFEAGDEEEETQAEDEADDADDADDAEDVEGDDEDDEADLEELANAGFGKGGGAAKKSSGQYVGGKVVKESIIPHKRRKKINLAEAKMKSRFKKLANIK